MASIKTGLFLNEVKVVSKVTANDIIEKFQFELLAGEEGIYRPITTSDISRPGIEMAGFFYVLSSASTSVNWTNGTVFLKVAF